MFKTARRLCEAIECLTSATEALRSSVVVARDWSAEHGNVEARLEELERERHLFQAEIHGELLKAQAEYRKADNAEKRAKNARDGSNGFDDGDGESMEELGQRYLTWVQDRDAELGATGGLPEVRPDMESGPSIVETLRAGKRSR